MANGIAPFLMTLSDLRCHCKPFQMQFFSQLRNS